MGEKESMHMKEGSIKNPHAEEEIYQLEKGISIARVMPHHRDELFKISEKIWEGEDYIPTMWDEWIHEEGFYAILLRNKVIGCMKYTKLPKNEILMEGLRMAPEFEGKGYASMAVDFLMGLVDAQNPGTLRFATSDENVYSHHFGEKYGFEKIASFYHRYMKGTEIREKVESINRNLRTNEPGILPEEGRILQASIHDFGRVMAFVQTSDEWKPSHNLLSSGWVFYPYTDDGLISLLNSRFSFIFEREGIITGIILADHSRQYPTDIDISWLSGDEGSVNALLTHLFLEVDKETVQEIAGKLSTRTMAEFAEQFGLHRHPRVDGTHVFEKRQS